MMYPKLADESYPKERQESLERDAHCLACAWNDFDIVEQSASVVVQRFGATALPDLGALRLQKDPTFVALQTACVVGYVRPFLAGLERLNDMYGIYIKPEWQELHESLFDWQERLVGVRNDYREHIVAREKEQKSFFIGEASAVLEPLKDFGMLRDMCADRKAKLWSDLQNAVAQCYPFLHHPVLLTLSNSAHP